MHMKYVDISKNILMDNKYENTQFIDATRLCEKTVIISFIVNLLIVQV